MQIQNPIVWFQSAASMYSIRLVCFSQTNVTRKEASTLQQTKGFTGLKLNWKLSVNSWP